MGKFLGVNALSFDESESASSSELSEIRAV